MSDIFEQNRLLKQQDNFQPKTVKDLDFANEEAEFAEYERKNNEELLALKQKYMVDLAPEEYKLLNEAIANAEIPEDEAYRWASALELNKQHGVSLQDAYTNLEDYTKALWGEERTFTPKTNFKAIVDYGNIGVNTVKLGKLGNQLMMAEIAGNEEKVKDVLAQIEAIESENESLADNQDRRWYIEALKMGAQSAPFTGYVATAGLIGGLVSGGLGTGLAFAASMELAQGMEYVDLRKEGATKENALAMSVFSGSMQALVETALGNVAGVLGKNAVGAGTKKAITEKITGNLFKRLHYDKTFANLAVKMGSEYLKENFEEGMEEVIQDLISKGTHALAAELEEYDIEPMTAESVAKDAWENFKGGILGSLVLGIGSTAINTSATIKDYSAVKEAASSIPSDEAYEKIVSESPVFKGMETEERTELIKKIREDNRGKLDESIQKQTEDIAEAVSYDENMERFTSEIDEDGNEIPGTRQEVGEAARDEDGNLYHEISEPHENKDGTYSSEMVFGDPSKETQNQYGKINVTVDEDNNTVTIDNFQTSETRQDLRNEMYADMAKYFEGYDIKWDPKSDGLKAIKEQLIGLNPQGPEAGLNYYGGKNVSIEEKDNQQARQRLLREIDGKFKMSNEEKALFVAMQEAAANAQEKSLSQYLEDTFPDFGIMGNTAELEEAARKESLKKRKQINAAGGMAMVDTVKGAKAIIYAASNADFSTAIHEFVHAWTKTLSGALEKEAAETFGATLNEDGSYNWDAKVTLADGTVVSAYENLAYSLEKYAENGKAENPQQQKVLQKLAEFIKHCIKTLREAVELSPEANEFFNKYFDISEKILADAENAVAETTNNVAQSENVASQETTETTENLTISGENLIENDEALSDEEIKTLVSDFTNEELKTLTDAGLITEETAQAVQETKLDDVTQAAVASILDDQTIPQEKKVEAVMKANGESYRIKQENIERYQARTDLTEEEKKAAIDDILNNRTTDRNGGGQAFSTLESGKDMLFQAKKAKKNNSKDFIEFGVGDQGKEYLQSTDSPIEAAEFLLSNKSGFVRNAFKDTKFGNVGLIYGDSDKGLFHIILKHIIELDDFNSVSEALNKIDDLLKNGTEIAPNKKDKKIIASGENVNKRIEKDGYRLILGKNPSGDFVVTAFDFTRNETIKRRTEENATLFDRDAFIKDGTLVPLTSDTKKDNTKPNNSSILLQTEIRKNELLGNDNDILFQEEEDKLYEEVINNGDKEKAIQMLQKKAEENGYLKADYFGNGSWAAPTAVVDNAEDFSNLDALQEYNDDYGGEVNVYGIINGIQGHDENYYFDPSRAGFHGQAASDTAQVYRKLRYDKAGPDTEVTVYRAVPNDINGEKLMRGDWIALSKNYCEEHGNGRYGEGNFHIIEEKVAIKNIWQGEEDMREFGFDDGKSDVEKNVSNNRKLLEITYDDNGNLIPLSQRFNEQNPSILFQEAEPGTEFQTVYHGSPHILKKVGGQLIRGEELGFDHSKMGTGEGAQAFGWGSYVTQVEGIANDYARKLTSVPGTLFVSLEGKKDFIKQRKASLRNLDNGKYEERINKNIRNFTKELKAAQKAQDNDEIKFYEDLIKTSQEDLNPEAKEKYREAFLKDIEKTEAEIKELKAQIKEAEKAIANVYTLEIPSDSENYIQWDKEITPLQYDRIVKQAEAENLKLYSGEDLYSVSEYGLTTTNGEKLYHELIKETKKTDKEISQFLNRAGFTGISYPANATTGGREDGARNFVIFNEDDIKVTEWHGKDKNGNILFQETIPQAILNEAAQFENWMDYRDFMEATNMGTEGVPVDASADWYLNTWEIAHNVSPTTAERNAAEMQEKKEQRDEARRDPVMVDAEWYTMIQKPGNLEAFLKLVYQATHIDTQEMASLNEEEAAYVQDIINRTERMFHHGVYSGNITRVHNGKELTNKARETMLTLMGQRKRDYRAIYADITGQSEYLVEKSDLQKENANIAKDALRYKLISYASEVDAMSPEEKTKLLDQIKDESIREKFKKDNVKMLDPDVEHYINMLESDIKTRNKELAAMRTDFNEDVERMASKQERDIIRQYEQYLNAKSEADFRKIPLPAGSKNAERIGEKYKRQVQSGMKHSFTGMVQDWDTLKTEIEANVKAQERLRAENRISELEEKIRAEYDAKRVKTLMSKAERLNAMAKEYTQKQQEVAAAKKLREMRKALVKRVMRRVNFNTIDYNRAKQIIAVQKVFDPNLRGGINKWIGTENKLAREVWSAWNTDFEAKENMLKRLSNRGKLDVIRLLEQTKTEEDFEKLTKKEQKMIERAMPRQDWIKELKLDIWKDERDNALQLPIKEITETQYVTQADGTKKPVEVTRVEFPSEIEELLVQSIGQDMTYAIQYRHFEDWTTGDMEELARRMDKMFKEGRDMLAARREAERIQADRIRERIREAINNTGIVINEDDPEDVKKKKQAKIDKILGVNQQLPGSTGSKKEKQQTFIDRLLHSYHDANIRRVARMLDNFSEGELTNLLYWQENDCFNREERAKSRRNAKIDEAIQNNKLDMRKLGKVIEFNGTKYTWDDVLMVWAAKMNQDDYYAEQLKDNPELKEEYALEESAYKAIKYGNMILDTERENFRKIDEKILEAEKERKEKLHAAELAGDEEAVKLYSQIPSDIVDANGNLELKGTVALKALAENRIKGLLAASAEVYKEFKPLIDAIRKDYSEEFDHINEVSIREFNAPVWREKWYLPLIRLTAAGDTHEQRLKQDLLGHSAGTGKAGTEKGFTKKRVEIGPMNQAPVELGLYSTWADSVERNEHFIAYAGYVRELNRVLFSKDAVGTMQEIENRYGKAMKDYLDVYVKEIANPNIEEPKKGLDRVMHAMRGNTAPAYLGWKFSSVLKQGIESPAPFMQFINPAEYMHGAIQLATKKWTRDSIGEKSAFMKSRVFDPIADLINENVEKSFSKPSYYLKKFEQKGMEGLEWIDWACVTPGWIAIYEKEYARLQETEQARYDARVEELTEQNDTRFGQYRMTEQQIKQQAHDDVTRDIETEAVNKADDCVRLCQPSNRKVDLAPMFKNNSEAAKAVLQFQTALNVIWQNIRYDIPYAVKNKQYMNIVGMVLGYVMAGVISGMVTEGLLKDDDEPEDVAQRLGYYATTQFVDSIPIVGGNLDALAKKAITGEKSGLYNSSLWPTFDKYYNAASSFISEDYDKALKNLEQGLLLTTGLPLSGIKEVEAALGINDGEEGLDFNPEAFLGRR